MGLFGRDDRAQSSSATRGRPDRATAAPSRHHDQLGTRTIITDTILVEGTLSGSGQITVDGRVRGSIDGKDEVVVARTGAGRCDRSRSLVVVAGRVIGDITADEKIELEPTAQVDGDITAPRILIKDGATFSGKVNMKTPEPRRRAHDVERAQGRPPNPTSAESTDSRLSQGPTAQPVRSETQLSRFDSFSALTITPDRSGCRPRMGCTVRDKCPPRSGTPSS